MRRHLALLPAFALLIGADRAFAQARNPFGVGISEGGGSPTGITGWILAQQGWFEHQLSLGVRAVHTDGTALWWLIGIGFVYGVFHAAGPGHGKAVLASYMIANERALQRGIVLSCLAALLQGAVAIAIVGALTLVLHATAQHMKDVASFVELASFASVTCLGAWLVWRKGRTFWALCRRSLAAPISRVRGAERFDVALSSFAMSGEPNRLAFAGAPLARPAAARFVCVDADAEGEHAPGCACHAVDPSRLGAPRLSWREAGLTVLAAGARPCSGAILVLVFAAVQGVFLAGIASVLAMSIGVAITTGALASLAVLAKGVARRLVKPGTRKAALAIAALELAAALAVLVAGGALLAGTAAVS